MTRNIKDGGQNLKMLPDIEAQLKMYKQSFVNSLMISVLFAL